MCEGVRLIAEEGPPHPWDGAMRQRLLGERVLCLPLHLVVLYPLALIRVVALAVIAILMVLSVRMMRSRRAVDVALSVLGRCVLCCFGVWPGLLRIEGENQWTQAPVTVVAPHLGLLEAFFFLHHGLPRPIALEPYTKIPVVADLFRACQGIAVPLPCAPIDKKQASLSPAPDPSHTCEREDGKPREKPRSASATQAVRTAIQAHKQAWSTAPAASTKPIVILPEGTTHNGRSLLRFFSGAFEGGMPVQPVLLHFPYTRVNAAHFQTTLAAHLAVSRATPRTLWDARQSASPWWPRQPRYLQSCWLKLSPQCRFPLCQCLLTSPWVRMTATFLPVYQPSEEECVNADVYAENVRQLMAAKAQLPLSTYSAKDLRRELEEQRLRGGTQRTNGHTAAHAS